MFYIIWFRYTHPIINVYSSSTVSHQYKNSFHSSRTIHYYYTHMFLYYTVPLSNVIYPLLLWFHKSQNNITIMSIMWVKQFHKPSPSHHHCYRWITIVYNNSFHIADPIHIDNVRLVKNRGAGLVYHLSSNKPVAKGVCSNPSIFINQ